MAIEAVDIFTNDLLVNAVKRCAEKPLNIEVITDKVGLAISIRQSFVREHVDLIRMYDIRIGYAVYGVHSGKFTFPNTNSTIVFRGVRQGKQGDVDEILYENAGRAGSYGRKVKAQVESTLPFDDELYSVVESGNDDLYDFISGFGPDQND